MKKILSVALIIVLALCLSVGVLADDAQYKATANPEKLLCVRQSERGRADGRGS